VPVTVLLFVISNQANVPAPLTADAAPVYKQESVIFGLPSRLIIPKISVDVPIEQVGITKEGDMDVPKGREEAGWYKKGPRPGERGSSVITAHYGWWDHQSGAFNKLHQLQPGDKIYVKDKKGETTVFVMRGSRSYDPDADATSVFKSRDGKSHLNLITCEGFWDEDQKSYSNRLVVFADLEET
jgi:LPXTG-site transpeptidase (sortase) family protein